MKTINGFTCGMGIGGWLTNYKRFNVLPDKWRWTLTIGDFEHFESYITETDVKNIAKMGFDHVRVGFDQVVLEKEPFVYREEIFQLLENFVGWCRKYGLNIVFNLHKAVGNYCDIELTETLLESEALQERFVALWEKLEERFHADTGIAFELLNEVVDVDPEIWNNLVEKTVKRLRALNPTRLLVVGGTSWNSVNKLDKMRVYDDENIIYTFHTYAPFEFTHQRGVLQAAPLFYNRKMYYPGEIEPYRDYQRVVYGAKNPYAQFEKMNKEYIYSTFAPAKKWVDEHPDKILWCGEFGTIRHADITSRENWMNDVISVLKEYDIPYCVWNYLSTPNDGNRFSLVDDESRKFVSERLQKICLGDVE